MKTSINFALIFLFLIHFYFSITLSTNISQNNNISNKKETGSSAQITNPQASSDSTQYSQVMIKGKPHTYD